MRSNVRVAIVAAAGSHHEPLGAELARLKYSVVDVTDFPDVLVFVSGDDEMSTLGDALELTTSIGSRERPVRVLTVSCAAPEGGIRRPQHGPGRVVAGAFFKSAAAELPSLSVVTALEMPPTATIEDVARCVVTELDSGARADVRYDARARHEVDWRPEAPETPSTEAPLGADSVFAITGGARGITGLICRTLASRFEPVLELCGRSRPLSDDERSCWSGLDQGAFASRYLRETPGATAGAVARAWRELSRRKETTDTLDALRKTGARVRYSVVDAADSEAVRSWLGEIRQLHGKIDVVLHGAGVLRDGRVTEKTRATMEPVIYTKLRAVDDLLDVASQMRAHTILFSSVAALHGNAGQADYAAANENLSLRARSTSQPVLSIAWGPWRDTGMTAGEVSRRLDSSGVALLEAEAGVAAFMAELVARTTGEIAILGGFP